MSAITVKQKRALKFMYDFIQVNSYAPTVRDVQAELGLLSSSTAFGYFTRLRDQGFISMEDKLPRTLKVLPKGETALIECKGISDEQKI